MADLGALAAQLAAAFSEVVTPDPVMLHRGEAQIRQLEDTPGVFAACLVPRGHMAGSHILTTGLTLELVTRAHPCIMHAAGLSEPERVHGRPMCCGDLPEERRGPQLAQLWDARVRGTSRRLVGRHG